MNPPHDDCSDAINARRTGIARPDFFGPAADSLDGHLNADELSRVVTTALASCLAAFVAVTALHVLGVLAFPTPADASAATLLFVTGAEARRRLGHGGHRPPGNPILNRAKR